MDKQTFSADILKYWYLLEFLSQPDFPYQDNAEKEECHKAQKGTSKRKQISVFQDLKADSLIFGTSDFHVAIAEIIEKQSHTYRHYPVASDASELCIGKIKREVLVKRLECLSDQKSKSPEKKSSVVALVGLKCDQNGTYIPGSFNVSPLVWGIHRLIKHQKSADYTVLLSTDAYDEDMERLETVLLNGGSRTGEPLTRELLNKLVEVVWQTYLLDVIGSNDLVIWDGILVSRRYTTEETKAEDSEVYRESELSHSFFSKDLLMVSRAVVSMGFGGSSMQQELLDYICGPYAEVHPELGWNETAERVDIFDGKACGTSQQMDFLHDRFEISNAPHGKWPSRFSPALMQQLAINSCWCSVPENQTIFSVNGPPGTGKTTLLKEVIAGNIVERAYKLAQYASPDEAFVQKFFKDGDKPNNGYSQYYSSYYGFKDDSLKDYGILVTSCNNLAVENITRELPDGAALLKGLEADKKSSEKIKQGLQEVSTLFDVEAAEKLTYRVWNDEIKNYEPCDFSDVYFTKLANDLANGLLKRSATVQDRWGLISAPFGKRSNIKCYINKVLKPYVTSFGANEAIEKSAKEYPEAAERFLKQYRKVTELRNSLEEVSGARKRYLCEEAELHAQIELTEQQIKTLEEAEQMLQIEIQKLYASIKSAEQELSDLQNEAVALNGEMLAQENKQQALECEIEGLRQRIIQMEQSRRFWDYVLELLRKPSMLSKDIQEKYLTLEKAKKELQTQAEAVAFASQRYADQQKCCQAKADSIFQLKSANSVLAKRKEAVSKQQDDLRNKIQDCVRKINEACDIYRAILKKAQDEEPSVRMAVLDEEFLSLFNSEDEKEVCSAHLLNPWQTAEYDREREKLSFEALRLHKAFLLGSKCCLWNLKNLLLIWNEPGDEKKPVSVTERDTVFLLTPVISTTFASAETMLESIETPGEIGCLIIDEAGQAGPQMAVGALYRSRRAIVVGDPRQVEPVVTDELDLIKRIVRDSSTKYYQDKTLSVQGFADRLNRIGTYYADETEKLWVGCPLVVHRRCISPMFDISNALSYSHIMKQQTKMPDPERESTFCKENSGWINVCGSENNTKAKDHYVQTQGEKAWELVLKAFEKTGGIPSLFVITPFNSVKKGFVRFLKEQQAYRDNPQIREWAENCIGTVHTFQGREADQVIFLLGCDKNSVSAAKWVNTNIVNVAVTRAKYRLYVIGDYLVWKESGILRKVKGILDSYAIRGLAGLVENDSSPSNQKQAEYLLRQLPDADSLTVDGEPDEQLLSPLSNELAALLRKQSLTSEQLESFYLSKEDIVQLPQEIRNRLEQGVFQHCILTRIKAQYGVGLKDASGTGVMFCKLMETFLKEQLLGKFKEYFSEMKEHKAYLKEPYEKVMLGTFTRILGDKTCLKELANKGAVVFGSPCDLQWWTSYQEKLADFKDLRNACCHSEPFSWEQYEQMLKILFEQREFMNTLVGDALPA